MEDGTAKGVKDLVEAGNLESMDSLLTRVDLPPFPPTSDLYPSLSSSLQVLRVSVHVLGTLSNSHHGFQRLALNRCLGKYCPWTTELLLKLFMKNYLNNWSTVGPEWLSSFCHCYCIVLRVICILYRQSNKPKSADFLLIELNHLKKISGKFKLRYSIHYEIEAGDAILICRIGGHIMWCHEKSHSKRKCCKTMWKE